MIIDDLGFTNKRIERLLLGAFGEQQWTTETAKSRLSEVLRRARQGETQVIGKRKPVILISVSELERIVSTFSQPETWGERFLPRPSEKGLGDALELPDNGRSGHYKLDLDIE